MKKAPASGAFSGDLPERRLGAGLYQRLHRVLTASAACSRAECVGKSGAAAVAALNGV